MKSKKHIEDMINISSINAYSFATASWRGKNNDPRELHDSQLANFIVKESKEGSVEITIKLIGAFYDRYLYLRYLNVDNYFFRNKSSHGDLLRNEVRLSDTMKVIHEIEWGIDDNWMIECEDIIYSYRLFEKAD